MPDPEPEPRCPDPDDRDPPRGTARARPPAPAARLTPAEAEMLRGLAAKLGAVSAVLDRSVGHETELRERRRTWRAEHGAVAAAAAVAAAGARTIPERLCHLGAPKLRIAVGGGKGRVLRTTAPVELGEVLLAEPPLVTVTVPADVPARDWATDAIQRAFRLIEPVLAAPEASREVMRDLHNAHAAEAERIAEILAGVPAAAAAIARGQDPIELARLVGITWTNAHGHQPDPSGATGGSISVLPVTAMSAHSCAPNAVFGLYEGVGFLQAAAPIPEDTEVTVSYLEAGMPDLDRAVRLAWGYGFICDCPRCGGIGTDELARAIASVAARAEPLSAGPTAGLREVFLARVGRVLDGRRPAGGVPPGPLGSLP